MDVVIDAVCETLPSGSKPLLTQGDFVLNILRALGYPDQTPPAADFLRQCLGLEGQWLIASPIHWQATHNDAMITDYGPALGLSDQMARVFFAEIAQFLQLDNIQCVYYSPSIWLINADGKPPITSLPLNRMQHHSMMPVLEKLSESLYWQRLLTEIQMFFSNHPLNLSKTLPTVINGLWFWGEGVFEPSERAVLSQDSPLLMPFKNGQLLTEQSVLNQNDLLLLQHPEPAFIAALAEKTAKKTVNWYWNNDAYQTRRQRWWSKWKK